MRVADFSLSSRPPGEMKLDPESGMMDPMSRSESSRFPVTVSRLPVTRCEVCGRTLAYRPGQASAVLTQHYNRMHPEALTGAPDTTR